jgi:hypothetical protein
MSEFDPAKARRSKREYLITQVEAMRRVRPYYGYDSWITTDAYNEALDDVLNILRAGDGDGSDMDMED